MAYEKKKKQKREYKKYQLAQDHLDFRFSYNDEEKAALHAKLNGSTSITEDDLRRVSLLKSDQVPSVSNHTLDKLNALSKNRCKTQRRPSTRSHRKSHCIARHWVSHGQRYPKIHQSKYFPHNRFA